MIVQLQLPVGDFLLDPPYSVFNVNVNPPLRRVIIADLVYSPYTLPRESIVTDTSFAVAELIFAYV